ncbi:MAG: hypothetical protein P8046_14705, partial [Anaerolineales bacterium]
IAFWDLATLEYQADPKWPAAQEFYQPVRAYLSTTQPNFEENFETEQDYWKDVQLFGREYPFTTVATSVLEGAININPTLTAMENQAPFAPVFPQLQGENVAFQFDFSFEEMDPINTVATYKIEELAGHQLGSAFICDFHWEDREVFCGFDILQAGDLVGNSFQWVNIPDHQDIWHTYTVLVVYYEGNFFAFLDGHFAGYFEGLDPLGIQLVPRVEYQNNLILDLDNFKFWNLDDVMLGL